MGLLRKDKIWGKPGTLLQGCWSPPATYSSPPSETMAFKLMKIFCRRPLAAAISPVGNPITLAWSSPPPSSSKSNCSSSTLPALSFAIAVGFTAVVTHCCVSLLRSVSGSCLTDLPLDLTPNLSRRRSSHSCQDVLRSVVNCSTSKPFATTRADRTTSLL